MSEQPQLSIVDLKIVSQVIDVCAKRGAILPSEMKPVGIAYENIQNFVKWHEASATNAAQNEAVNKGEANE